MTTTPTVTAFPADSPLPARALVVGVEAGGASKAYPLERVQRSTGAGRHRGRCPIVVVVAEDGRSVRAFDCRVDGEDREFVLVPGTGLPVLVDLSSGTEWSFAGEALRGPLERPAAHPRPRSCSTTGSTGRPITPTPRCTGCGRRGRGRDRTPQRRGGRIATARSGAPLPPPIFIGRATIEAPRSGSRSSPVRFSNPGMLRA